jgi:hypothetical protein
MEGHIGDESAEFMIALGKAAQMKHRFQAAMKIRGLSVPVPDPRFETAGFYRASGSIRIRTPSACTFVTYAKKAS